MYGSNHVAPFCFFSIVLLCEKGFSFIFIFIFISFHLILYIFSSYFLTLYLPLFMSL